MRWRVGHIRVVVFTDPHGNLHAIEAAITKAAELSADHLVCAGDVAQFGPQPNACIERLRDANIPCVRGNHDRDILQPIVLLPNASPAQKALAEIHNWGCSQLTEASREYLGNLPFSWVIAPASDQGLVVLHGSPERDDDIVRPGMSPTVVAAHCRKLKCRAIVAGHLHVPFVEAEDGYLWVNAGTCGGSSKDGDPRGALAVLDWIGASWEAGIVRFPYDMDAAEKVLLSSSMPFAREIARCRRSATWFTLPS